MGFVNVSDVLPDNYAGLILFHVFQHAQEGLGRTPWRFRLVVAIGSPLLGVLWAFQISSLNALKDQTRCNEPLLRWSQWKGYFLLEDKRFDDKNHKMRNPDGTVQKKAAKK